MTITLQDLQVLDKEARISGGDYEQVFLEALGDYYRSGALQRLAELAEFGKTVLDEHRGELGDIDGGWIQDTAERIGLLVRVEVTEPCGENCQCAEYGDFPQECLRRTDSARAPSVKEGKL